MRFLVWTSVYALIHVSPGFTLIPFLLLLFASFVLAQFVFCFALFYYYSRMLVCYLRRDPKISCLCILMGAERGKISKMLVEEENHTKNIPYKHSSIKTRKIWKLKEKEMAKLSTQRSKIQICNCVNKTNRKFSKEETTMTNQYFKNCYLSLERNIKSALKYYLTRVGIAFTKNPDRSFGEDGGKEPSSVLVGAQACIANMEIMSCFCKNIKDRPITWTSDIISFCIPQNTPCPTTVILAYPCLLLL